MSTPLLRRTIHLEQAASAARRRMRERVERIARRLGGSIAPGDADVLAVRHMGTPARIQAWHRAGLTERGGLLDGAGTDADAS